MKNKTLILLLIIPMIIVGTLSFVILNILNFNRVWEWVNFFLFAIVLSGLFSNLMIVINLKNNYSSKTIITLLTIPLITGTLWTLFLISVLADKPLISELKNPHGLWFWILFAIALLGSFLNLIIVPLLFRNSLINWKNSNPSWKWQLPLILVAVFFGNLMIVSYGHLAIFIILTNLIVLGISILITLIMAARVNPKSSFFYILLGFTVIIGVAIAFGFYVASNVFIY